MDTARSLGDTSLPDEMPEVWGDDELMKLHHVLLEVGLPFERVRVGAEG